MSIIITWDENENFVIRDIHAKCHDRILKFMVEHQYRPHRLYEQLHLQDDAEVEQDYIACLKHLLRGECCIVVVPSEEWSDEILAVGILKWMTREWRSWTMFQLIPNTQQWMEFVKIQLLLLNTHANAQQLLDGDTQIPAYAMRPRDSLHLFEYYACDAIRDDPKFMDCFFKAICEVARHMHMPRVTFVAYSMLEQRHASEAGFVEVGIALYSMYLDHEGRRPFTVLRDLDEMYAALYERSVEPITPYPEMPGFEELIERMRIAELKGLPM